MPSNLTFLSLFSGCGGLDAGFTASGFKCLQAFDIDQKVIEVHRLNFGDTGVVADLRTATRNQLISKGKPTVIVSGSPCQGFSTAGKRDLHDPRNSLLLHAGRIATDIKPKVFVAENVSGALSGDHKTYWMQLDAMFRSAGYSTTTLKLNASELGLAQLRSRAIFIAWTGSREPKFAKLSPHKQTLANVLMGVETAKNHNKCPLLSDSPHFMISKRIKQGQKLCNVRGGSLSVHTWDIPEVFGEITLTERIVLETTMKLRRTERLRHYGDADPVSIQSLTREVGQEAEIVVRSLVKKGYMRELDGRYDLANTFNGKYRRLDWKSVSLTVDTRFGDPRYFLHPSEHRGFTVREAARIQGFPDSFSFHGRDADSFKMIGNAVPPPMAQYLAEAVRGLISK